jgi:hypothetical protein
MAHFRSRPRSALRLAAACALLVPALEAKAALANDIEYCNFASVTGLQLNGNAAQVGTTLRLSRNVITQDSSAFRTPTLALTAATDFHTHFQFVLTPGGNGQADGIAFVVQSDARGAGALGGNGGGIGYGMSNGGTRVQPAVEIEFDTYQNGWDPNNNHVGVMRNGDETTHLAVATPAFALAGGAPVDAWIDYAAATTTLSVFVSATGTKPGTALVTATVNIFATVGAAPYFGFTGSTGGASEQQILEMWILALGGLSECTCTTDAQCGGTTPHCAPAGDPLAGACVACVTDAQCDGSPDTNTPVCDKSGGASTDTCRACAASSECVGAALGPVCVGSGGHAGQCAQCAASTDCSGGTPVCFDTGPTNTCVQCSTNANCSGTTPICDGTSHACGPCAGDSDCTAPTPACQTTGPLTGECNQCSASNASQCAGHDPTCDTARGLCVACNANGDCAAMAPICLAHACVGCTSDYTITNPAPRSCPTPQLPACQTSGSLAGECTQCSPTNASVCASLPKQPVCVDGKEQCGCSQNSDCGAKTGLLCDASQPPAGQCVPGCTTTGGVDNCPQGETCVAGMCTAFGSDAGTDGGEGGASSSGGDDAGRDGGAVDGGSSSSGGAGSSSGSGGTMEDASSSGTAGDGSSGGSPEGGANADQAVSLEGGGCATAGAPASSLVTWVALGVVFATAGVVRRRRRGDR